MILTVNHQHSKLKRLAKSCVGSSSLAAPIFLGDLSPVVLYVLTCVLSWRPLQLLPGVGNLPGKLLAVWQTHAQSTMYASAG